MNVATTTHVGPYTLTPLLQTYILVAEETVRSNGIALLEVGTGSGKTLPNLLAAISSDHARGAI